MYWWLIVYVLFSYWSKVTFCQSSNVNHKIDLKNESEFKETLFHEITSYCTNHTQGTYNCIGKLYTDVMNNAFNSFGGNSSGNLITTHPIQAWGYSLGSATLICILSMLGVVLLRLKSSRILDYIIMIIQAFAVGVLSGNALIHLIPDGLGIDEVPWYDYTWKSFVSSLSVVVFCCTDAIIKLIGSWSSSKSLPIYTILDQCCSESHDSKINEHNIRDSNEIVGEKLSVKHSSPVLEETNKHQSHRVKCFGTLIESKGIMIIVGDLMHNLIDGLAIGVSFSTSVSKGLSTLLAVVAEEVPHEIGDMTILVSSGFSVCKAVLWNFISCLSCHLGVIISLSLGDLNKHTKDYIEMICGGAFLYISFSCVYPHVMEMCVRLSNQNLKRYQLNLLLVYFMVIVGQTFMAGVSYLE